MQEGSFDGAVTGGSQVNRMWRHQSNESVDDYTTILYTTRSAACGSSLTILLASWLRFRGAVASHLICIYPPLRDGSQYLFITGKFTGIGFFYGLLYFRTCHSVRQTRELLLSPETTWIAVAKRPAAPIVR